MREWVFTETIGSEVRIVVRIAANETVEYMGVVTTVVDGVVRLREDNERTHFILIAQVMAVTIEDE
jgi:hypothetical protein